MPSLLSWCHYFAPILFLIALTAHSVSLSAPAFRPKSKLRAKAMAIKMVAQLWADRQAEDYADPEANKGKSVSKLVMM